MPLPPNPDIVRELELESAARRTKAAELPLSNRVNALEARLARCEEALAAQAQDATGFVSWKMIPKLLAEICREFSNVKITPLENRVAELETRGTSNVRPLKSGTFNK